MTATPRTPSAVDELRTMLDDLIAKAADRDYCIAVTVPEAARMLGLKDTSVIDRLLQAGDIRGRKVRGSNRRLISVQSLHEYIGDTT